MTQENEPDRLVFILNTAQMISLIRPLTVDIKVFGSWDDDDPRYIGKRDSILNALRDKNQNEHVPTWNMDGVAYAVSEIRILLTESVCYECTTDFDEMCLFLKFVPSRFENKLLPELDSIPLSEMLDHRTSDFQTDILTVDLVLNPSKSILAPLAYTLGLICDEGIFDIEDGYYAGNRWRKSAAADCWANLLQSRELIRSYADQDFQTWANATGDRMLLTHRLVGTAITCGVGAIVDPARAREFWISVGADDSPSDEWVLGFCAGALREVEVNNI